MTENDKTRQQSETVNTQGREQGEAAKAKEREHAEAQKEKDRETRERHEREAQNRRDHAEAQGMNTVLARDCVPMFEGEGEEKPDPAELLEMMKGQEGLIEVVPSDGEKEILGAAYLVHGDHPWNTTLAGLKLETGGDWLVHGPGYGDVAKMATSVVGYGLFISGDQVAWSRRPDEIRLGPGTTLNLKDDVIF
jgi:hypothetical protein